MFGAFSHSAKWAKSRPTLKKINIPRSPQSKARDQSPTFITFSANLYLYSTRTLPLKDTDAMLISLSPFKKIWYAANWDSPPSPPPPPFEKGKRDRSRGSHSHTHDFLTVSNPKHSLPCALQLQSADTVYIRTQPFIDTSVGSLLLFSEKIRKNPNFGKTPQKCYSFSL